MKHVILFLITLYQQTVSVFLRHILGTASICRFSPSCSEYAKKSILKHGVLTGMYMSTRRILSCQPFNV